MSTATTLVFFGLGKGRELTLARVFVSDEGGRFAAFCCAWETGG